MQLHYLERGEGDPVILIHGLFGSAANLGMVARGLAQDFTVYSLDVRNHGRSPHADEMSYPVMAEDVVEFMDRVGIAQCSIMGHSMGGKIAMQTAMDFPDRVRKLAVADVAPVAYPPHHAATLAGLAAVEHARVNSRSEGDSVLARHIGDPGVRAFLLKSLQRDHNGEFHWVLNREAITHNYESLGAASEGNPWHGPALFIKGGDSDYIRAEHRETVMRLFPAARLKVIEGTGHWLHAEKPSLFNRMLLRFLLGG